MATISGTSGNDNLPRLTDPSTADDDIIYGLAGNDTINGGAGNDTMEGGADHDIYYVDSTSDVIIEEANAGTETVYADASYTLGANVENLYLDGSAYYGYGNELDNYIAGNSGNNFLWGSLGFDTMAGGLGHDVYSLALESTYDVIIEGVDAGTDTVYAYANYILGANIENLYLVGSTHAGYGNELNNYIVGNSNYNDIRGGAGIDTMAGGLGPDAYSVDSTSDVIIEGVEADSDTVFGYASYTLDANVENLYLVGSAYYGYGNELSNRIWGNVQNNYLSGEAGSDFLNGGTGNDTMAGGLDGDAYVVDSSSDVIIEDVNSGQDLVYLSDGYTSASYTLSDTLEDLSLSYFDSSGSSESKAYSGYGNALDNDISGNSLNNYLWGGAGNDTIIGGAGSDTMEGGSGSDTMEGGSGYDYYYVDSTSDVIIEDLNGGRDCVFLTDGYTSASYTLSDTLEDLSLSYLGYRSSESKAYSGYGNALDNDISGNSLNNYLWGGAGNDYIGGYAGIDTMEGGLGDDRYTFFGSDSNDVIIEDLNGGTDWVSVYTSYTLGANLENLAVEGMAGYGNTLDNHIMGSGYYNQYLWGGAGNDTIMGANYSGNGGNDTIIGGDGNDSLFGGDGNDSLFGGDGNDTIRGSAGSDVLTGGAGADYFNFYSASEGSNTITDFSKAEGDKVALSAIGFGSGLTTTTGVTPEALHPSQFIIGSAATDSSHRIIYNSSTGALSFDRDGIGTTNSAVQFATLSTGLDLVSSDFQVIA